jgi:hypothetical protein
MLGGGLICRLKMAFYVISCRRSVLFPVSKDGKVMPTARILHYYIVKILFLSIFFIFIFYFFWYKSRLARQEDIKGYME